MYIYNEILAIKKKKSCLLDLNGPSSYSVKWNKLEKDTYDLICGILKKNPHLQIKRIKWGLPGLGRYRKVEKIQTQL